MDIFLAARQRQALSELADALHSRAAAFRRDECSDWRIEGRYGCIYATPGGVLEERCPESPSFQLIVLGWAAKGWENAKKGLAFARLVNDGDGEGALFLDRLPTPDEAAAIRHYLGIFRKRDIGPEQLAAMALHAFKSSKNRSSGEAA